VTFRLRRKVIPRSRQATRDLRKIHVKVKGASALFVILSREAAKDLLLQPSSSGLLLPIFVCDMYQKKYKNWPQSKHGHYSLQMNL
jgi:hypothetical protein